MVWGSNAGKGEDRARELWTSGQTRGSRTAREKGHLKYSSQNMQIRVGNTLLYVQCAQKMEKQVFTPNRLVFEPNSLRLLGILSSSHWRWVTAFLGE